MKRTLKRVLQATWPGLYYFIASYRFQRYCRQHFWPFQQQFYQAVYAGRPIRVLSGPFAGLAYYNRIVWGPITPKWLGSYELELHPILELILARNYDVIMNIGAAEGYYAVGLAAQSPRSRVIAYDVDPLARQRQRQLATLNGVENLEIRSLCTHREIEAQGGDRCLLLVDIEGSEIELLDPQRCKALNRCDLLVELHHRGPDDVAAVRAILTTRFAASHQIQVIPLAARDPRAFQQAIPELHHLDLATLAEALQEYRYDSQCWLWMEAQPTQPAA